LNGHTITSEGSSPFGTSAVGIFATGVDDNIVGPGTLTGFC
jgi:hypothetical protein